MTLSSGTQAGVLGDFASRGGRQCAKLSREGMKWRGKVSPTHTHTHPVTAPSFGKDWSHTPVPLAEVQKREVCVQEGGGRAEIMQRINEIRTRQGQIMYHYTPETKGQHPEG